MERKFLYKAKSFPEGEIFIGGSKSESNRLLILNKLFGNQLQIKNLSDSEDTVLLQKALTATGDTIDVHHAGTAMRFLTAFFAIQENRNTVLTGSERMKQRPIGILVEALRSMGAEITYLEKQGFPPLLIKGRKPEKNFVELDGGVSSQFISSLILIAPKLENGLAIRLRGKTTSLPYLKMTIKWLKKLGIRIEETQDQIKIYSEKEIQPQTLVVESDWSSASYFYSLAALSKDSEIKLNTYFTDSFQGDASLVQIFRDHFGIETHFNSNQLTLSKMKDFHIHNFEMNLNDTPDLAQTIAVTAAGLKIKCKLTGLETLNIKETNRLTALRTELRKVGALAEITPDSLEITGFMEINELPFIKTYQDHRMAMSFSPLCMLMDLEIENPRVVEKSYPNFWKDLEKLFRK